MGLYMSHKDTKIQCFPKTRNPTNGNKPLHQQGFATLHQIGKHLPCSLRLLRSLFKAEPH